MKLNKNDRDIALALLGKMAIKYGCLVVECAKVILVHAGINALTTGEKVAIESNLVSAEVSQAIVECAREMARALNDSTSAMAIFSCILSEDSSAGEIVDGDTCPLCGGELAIDYERGVFAEAPWRCMDCGATVTQVSHTVFSHHKSVKNCCGEDVSPDDFCY